MKPKQITAQKTSTKCSTLFNVFTVLYYVDFKTKKKVRYQTTSGCCCRYFANIVEPPPFSSVNETRSRGSGAPPIGESRLM